MRILIVGGTPAHRGGLELFCERAQDALRLHGKHQVEWLPAHSSFARLSAASVVWNIWRLLHIRRKQPRPVVWLQYVNFLDLLILVVCRALGYRVLVTPHLGVNWLSQSNRVLRSVGTRLLASANAVGLLSPSQALELRIPATVGSRQIITFLPQALEVTSRLNDGEGEPLRLIHAARLSEGKGTFLFLAVCARLDKEGYAFRAQLVGSCDKETRDRIDDVIARENLAHRIEITGAVNENEVLGRLSRSDILIHLSSVDSFPLVVLESLGCGAYPICLDLSGARNIVRTYGGQLVGGADPVSETVSFIRDVDVGALREGAAERQRRIGQDFRWAKAVQAVEVALRDVSQDFVAVPVATASSSFEDK